MSKSIVVRLKKAGNRSSTFSISDDLGNVLATALTKKQLIEGMAFSVDDSVSAVLVTSEGKPCCNESWVIPVTKSSIYQLAQFKTEEVNTSSLWRHLTNPVVYNNFYGCIHPYIIEYPFSYQYYDEIVQNVKDYTKAYTYLPIPDGVFNNNIKVETDKEYFNKAILYNGQQCTGILELEPKPSHDLKSYMSYPKLKSDGKAITFTKSDNFYQYNTFWSVLKNKQIPVFKTSCESLSIDKTIDQSNMDYSSRSFKKEPLRAKELKVRHILDDKSNIHLVSQFIVAPAQISYK